MTALLARLQGARRSGSGWAAFCPAHEDRHRSLSVGVGRDGRWLLTCHAGCGYEQVLAAAGLQVADLGNGTAPAGPITKPVGPHEREQLRAYALACRERLGTDPRAQHVLGYLAARFRLDLEAALQLNVGFDPGDVERPDFVRWREPRLVLPLVARGRLVGLQARELRAGGLRWASPAGSGWGRAGVFGLDRPGPIIVTEGPSDALAAAGLGFPAVAVRGAALGATEERARRALRDVLDELRGRDVVVAGDGDEPGRKFNLGVREALAGVARSVRMAPIPDGIDLAALALRQGPDTARRLLGMGA